MAMTKCKECGNEISTKADACPKCGAKIRRTGCLTMGIAILIALVVLFMIVGSCQQAREGGGSTSYTPSTSTSSTPSASTGNRANDGLLALSDSDRNNLFTRYMSGQKCGRVTRNFYQGINKGEAFWSVECSDGSQYGVLVKPDANGSTRIMDCGVMKMLGVKCFERW